MTEAPSHMAGFCPVTQMLRLWFIVTRRFVRTGTSRVNLADGKL